MKRSWFWLFACLSALSWAEDYSCSNLPAQVNDLGDMSLVLACQMPGIVEFMIAVSYLSGVGFGVAAVFKFKQVKENPTQIPISTPFALLFVSALLVFLPGVIQPAGASLFGLNAVTDGSNVSSADGIQGGDLIQF